MVKKLGTFFVWLLLVALFFVLLNRRDAEVNEPVVISTEHFMADVEAGRVAEVYVEDNLMMVTLAGSGEEYATQPLYDGEHYQKLQQANVPIRWDVHSSWFDSVIGYLVLALLFVGLLVFFFRRAQRDGANILSLRRTRAKLIPEKSKVTFAEVGGLSLAKESLQDIVNYLKHSETWVSAGVRPPRGILLEGPPGCGKTLLARAVAGETDASFFVVSASEFVEMFVGVGAARVRDTFETAAKEAPAVVFIDELDAVGRRRGSGIGAGHDEREQTLNQLLVCLDGITDTESVVVIAATNRPDILDRALLRPGRFDRHITLPALSRDDRVEVLRIHSRNKQLGDGVLLEELAEQTFGFSGADLENIMNEAAVFAVRRASSSNGSGVEVTRQDLNDAVADTNRRVDHLNKLDLLLAESAAQLVQPSGKAVARLTLRDGNIVEGEAVWADAAFIKLRRNNSQDELVVPKVQILKIEALPGTEAAAPDDSASDPWANVRPNLA